MVWAFIRVWILMVVHGYPWSTIKYHAVHGDSWSPFRRGLNAVSVLKFFDAYLSEYLKTLTADSDDIEDTQSKLDPFNSTL